MDRKLQVLETYQKKLDLDDLALSRMISFPPSHTVSYKLDAYLRKAIRTRKGVYGRKPSISKSILIMLELLIELDAMGYPLSDFIPEIETGFISPDIWNGDQNKIRKKLSSIGDGTLYEDNQFFKEARLYCECDRLNWGHIFFEMQKPSDIDTKVSRIELPTRQGPVKPFNKLLAHLLCFAFSEGIDIQKVINKVSAMI